MVSLCSFFHNHHKLQHSMKSEEKREVANTLSEKGIWIRIGFLPFRLRPITLAQIYEMGAIANDINADGVEEKKKIKSRAETIAHYNDAKIMSKVFVICLFRSLLMRFLFGWYIRHNLTMREYEKLITFESTSFNINFFLTSIIFLKKTTTMTNPNPTTAHGQQWVES